MGRKLNAPLILPEHSGTPSTPGSGEIAVYARDGALHVLDDLGIDTELGAAGEGGGGGGGDVELETGTTTIPDTASSVVVPHGLSGVPNVVATPHDNEHVWVSARGASTFLLEREGTEGNLDVDWFATPAPPAADAGLRDAIIALSPSHYYPCDELLSTEQLIPVAGGFGSQGNNPLAQSPVEFTGGRRFGVGRYCTAGSQQYLQTANFSSGTQTIHIIGRFDASSDGIFIRDNTNSGGCIPIDAFHAAPNWNFRWGGGNHNFGAVPPWYNTGVWHQLIIRKNGSTVDYWVDGVKAWTITSVSTAANNTFWRFCRNGTNPQYATGGAAHWAMWNTALSDVAVDELIAQAGF